MSTPREVDFGFGSVVELSYLQTVFGISRRTASKYLKALRLKPFYIGKEIYFSLSTFKRIMFVLSKPNGAGFVFPGSAMKNNPRYKKNPDYIVMVTDEILAEAAEPKTLSEMAGAEGRNPGILKQFLTRPPGRPLKGVKNDNS